MRRPSSVLVVAVVAIGLVVASCSSGGSTADEQEGGTGSTEQGGPSGTLRQAVDFDFPGFDTMSGNAATAMPFLRPVFDALVLPAEGGTIEPWVATEWTVEGTDVSLTLRDDVQFSDGSDLDAEAVKANLERGRDLYATGTTQIAAFGDIESVDVVDATHLDIHLTGPSSTFLNGLAGAAGLIMAPSSLDDPELDRNPVGSGPYRYDAGASNVGAVIVYQASPDYWAPEVQGVETIELNTMTDGSARQNALLAGEIDLTVVDSAIAVDLADEERFELTSTPEVTNAIVILDREGTKVAALGDPRVRQAMSYAIDRELFVETLLAGLGTATSQPFSEQSLAYDETLDDAFDYDVEKAKDLLAEAGYADGFRVSAPTIPPIQDFITAMQGFLAEVGIEMELVAIDSSQYIAAPGTGDYEIWAATLPFANGEATVLYGALFDPDGLINGFKVEDAELAALDAQANTLVDPEARAAVERQMAARIVDQAFMITAAVSDRVAVYDTSVTGDFRWFSGDGQPSFWGLRVD